MAEDAKSFSPIRMTASSEEAAVAQALQIAGLSRDQVHVEVLRQDAKGVTVRVGPRRDEETSPGEITSDASPANYEANGASIDGASIDGGTSVDDDALDVQAADVATAAFEEDIFVTPEPAAMLDASSEDQSADSSDATPESAPHEYLSQTHISKQRDESRAAPVQAAPVEIDAETKERARAMAQEFLDRMGMEAQVEITRNESESGVDDGGRLHLNIEGEDVGILIGKHGQTLQAFQYLLNVSLNNQPSTESSDTTSDEAAPLDSRAETPRENWLRVVVDAGGYRSRRSQSLEQVARDAASRAKRDRRSVRLEPMPAYERRLVHLALQEDATVATTSEGRDPLRHVVVSPAGMRPTPGGGFNDRSSKSGGFNRSRGGFNSNRQGGNRGSGGGFDSR